MVGATVVYMIGLGRAVLRERRVCSEAMWDGVVRIPVAEDAAEGVRDAVTLDDATDLEEREGM